MAGAILDTVHQFVAAIKSYDVDALAALMAAELVFVDSRGNRVQGAASMAAITEGDTALVSGEAGGSIDGIAWRTPAAWQAVVCDGKLTEWRVFADIEPVYEIRAMRQA